MKIVSQDAPRKKPRGFACAAAMAGLVAVSIFPLRTHAQEAPALINVATRGTAGAGDNAMIAGFIVSGTSSRRVAIRVIGPSLVNFGLTGVLPDPTLTLNSGGTDIATNDDWQSDADSAAALRAANLGPSSDREAGLVRTLAPGGYTVLVGGKGTATGVALIEVYDLDGSDPLSTSRVVNLSTRGRVSGGENVMIMGFILGGSSSHDVLVNAIAGSLAEFGVTGALSDPKVEIYSGSQKIAESDDWIDSPSFDTIARTGASPRDPLESAVFLHLAPGGYTAVVSGVNGAQGVALPEVYEIRGLQNTRFSPDAIGGRTGKLAISTGTAPESLDFVFGPSGSATVNAGTAGTFTYSVSDDFRASLSIDAGGYTVSGKLQFYRDKIAVFDGTLKKPGGAAQTAGGILILN